MKMFNLFCDILGAVSFFGQS